MPRSRRLWPPFRTRIAAKSRHRSSAPILQSNKLGSMGPPVKLTIEGQSVFLCCDGCKDAATENPAATLAKVAALKAKKPSKPLFNKANGASAHRPPTRRKPRSRPPWPACPRPIASWPNRKSSARCWKPAGWARWARPSSSSRRPAGLHLLRRLPRRGPGQPPGTLAKVNNGNQVTSCPIEDELVLTWCPAAAAAAEGVQT